MTDLLVLKERAPPSKRKFLSRYCEQSFYGLTQWVRGTLRGINRRDGTDFSLHFGANLAGLDTLKFGPFTHIARGPPERSGSSNRLDVDFLALLAHGASTARVMAWS